MSWEYRVARKLINLPGNYPRSHPFDISRIPEPLYEYGIVEAYDGGASYTSFTQPQSDDEFRNDPIKSLRWQLEHMLKALDKPVIDLKDE